MKVTFVVRLHKLNGSRLGFYVPKAVFEFYDLHAGAISGFIRWRADELRGRVQWNGNEPLHTLNRPYQAAELPDLGTKLYRHPVGLRGVIPRWTTMPEAGTLVELTIDGG